MPTTEITASDANVFLFNDITGDPAVLISGHRNRITILDNVDLASTAGGPAVVFSGAQNSLILSGTRRGRPRRLPVVRDSIFRARAAGRRSTSGRRRAAPT